MNVVVEHRAGKRWKIRGSWRDLQDALRCLLRGAVLWLAMDQPHDLEALLGVLRGLEARVLAAVAERRQA